MFSPHEGGPATATRSRRRQRPVSSDSLAQQPKAKRQRLPLTEQTFAHPEPDAPPEMFQVKPDKAALLGAAKRDGVENANGGPNNIHGVHTSGHGLPKSSTTSSLAAPKRELSVRPKKPKAGERVTKGDGGVILASNNAYTVSKLPALPDRLRSGPGGRQHGNVYAASGYAVSLTHTHAVVWPYTANSPSPETFTFTLPYPSRHVSDPLPLGALVAPPASSDEPGLVVVMPTTGKVSYWESISSAATLDFLRQQRNGVEDVIHGLSSSERITDLVNAEPAGFVLVTSTGRLAYMSVRDGHGRPAISVQFMRFSGGGGGGSGSGLGSGIGGGSGSGPSSAAAGFFGSIRHALSAAAHREDIVAVRAGPLRRVGERSVVSATARGKFTGWTVHRGGSYDAVLEVDARDRMARAIRQLDVLVDAADAEALEVLDFAFVPAGIERKYADAVRLSNPSARDSSGASAPAPAPHQLLVLVSLPTKKQKPYYYLVELLLSPVASETRVGMVRPIASVAFPAAGRRSSRQQPKQGQAPQEQDQQQQPRIYLPRPGVVAYLVFGRAVVVVSLAQPPETPDAQLQGEGSNALALTLPSTFEDVIDLRSDGVSEIVGSGIEEPVGSGGGGVEPYDEGGLTAAAAAAAAADLDVVSDGGAAVVGYRTAAAHRHRSKNPAVVLLVRGVGLVRVATVDVERFIGEKPPEVTAKSKLEQAVFYGIKDDNPLVFEGGARGGRGGGAAAFFSDEEIGEAAMALSGDILGSKTAFTPRVPASLESSLRVRAGYLDRLMAHLNALHVGLSRRVRWRLLADAEKMATASCMWLLHEQFLAERGEGKTTADRKTIVSEIVEYIHEDEKKNPDREAGEVDRVRHFFVNDVGRMDLFVAWAYEVIKYVYRDHLLDDRGVTRLLYEGVELNARALDTATAFRREQRALYGLGGEPLEAGGILADDGSYGGLPEPWTSTYFVSNNVKRLVDLCCNWLDQFYGPAAANKAPAAKPDAGLLASIRTALPSLTDRYLLALLEHYRWTKRRGVDPAADAAADAISRRDPSQEQAAAAAGLTKVEAQRSYGERCAQAYADDRYAKVYRLKNYGLWDDAIAVAEKHGAITAMAGIMVEEVRTLRSEANTVDAGTLRASEKRAAAHAKEQRIAADFATYGEPFAFAVYELLLRDDGIKAVLDFPGDTAGYATRFLRARPELAKISWINDVEREHDVASAADTLLALGLEREPQVWNKKIELSLSKLALLAEQGQASPRAATAAAAAAAAAVSSPSAPADHAVEESLDKVNRQLRVIQIQDLVHSWVLPSVVAAVDEAAELQLALERHGGRVPKRQKAAMQVLEGGLRRLLRHEALDAWALIDVLTLIDVPREEARVEDDVFFLALRVADAGLAGEARRQAQRLVWRRCFVRDDWAAINNTQLQDDAATAAVLARTSVYSTTYALAVQDHLDGTQAAAAVVKPSEALGVFTDASEAAAAARFGHLDDPLREKLLDMMRHEDSVLRRYLDKCRLGDWCRAAAEFAEKAVQAEMDRLTETQSGGGSSGGGGGGAAAAARLRSALFGPRSV